MGRFHLTGLPSAPRGLPQIEVTFDIDANGIVNVAAKDKATGKEQTITISGASGLSKDEVDRMVKEAQSHAADDAGRREVIELRNRADALIHSVEKTYTENKAKLGAESARIRSRRSKPRRRLWVRRTKPISRQRPRSWKRRRTPWPRSFTRPARRTRTRSRQADGATKDGEVVDAEYAETT